MIGPSASHVGEVYLSILLERVYKKVNSLLKTTRFSKSSQLFNLKSVFSFLLMSIERKLPYIVYYFLPLGVSLGIMSSTVIIFYG